MSEINKLIEQNSIIKRMIIEKNINSDSLKQIYWQLCKETHPDITKKDSSDFLLLQNDYREAKNSLKDIINYLNRKNELLNLTEDEIKNNLFNSLKIYTIKGLHSVRLRRKPHLKSRNASILQDVIYWAFLYDKKFYHIFVNYNKNYFKVFKDWEKEKNFFRARKFFINGLRNFFLHLENKNKGSYNTSLRYLNDALYTIKFCNKDFLTINLFNFTTWILNELKKNN